MIIQKKNESGDKEEKDNPPQNDNAENKAMELKSTDENNKESAILAEAQQSDAAKDYKKAAKIYEQLITLSPSDENYFYLGNAYYNSKQYAKAITAYQETLRLDRNYPKAKEYLADAEKAKQAESDKRKSIWNGILNAASEAVKSEDNEEGGSKTNGNVVANGSLPAGKYQCRTMMVGGLIQERDSFHIYADGTYQVDNQNNAQSPYSYDANSGAIQWRGEGFSMAAKSWFNPENRLIFIRLGNEVWDCGIRGGQ